MFINSVAIELKNGVNIIFQFPLPVEARKTMVLGLVAQCFIQIKINAQTKN